MKRLLESILLGIALYAGGLPALAEEENAAAGDSPAVAEESSALIAKDIDADVDEDDGPVGRVIRKGVADMLEEHVLDRKSLSEEDREEIREAIAELRGEMDSEMQEAKKEVEDEVGAAKKKKRALVINNPMGHSADDDFGITQAFVASLAIIFSLGMPIIIVTLILYFGYRKRRLAHDTINGFLASGKDIPPEIMQNLFQDAGRSVQAPRTNLHKGTINTSLGLGMVIGFNAIDAEFLAAIGFIFLFVGLAQLLIWKLEQGKNGDKTQG